MQKSQTQEQTPEEPFDLEHISDYALELIYAKLAQQDRFKDIARVGRVSKRHQMISQKFLITPFDVKGVPYHIRSLIPSRPMLFPTFLEFMHYAMFIQNMTPPFKKSRSFKQCVNYNDTIVTDSLSHVWNKERDPEFEKIYESEAILSRYKPDQTIDWVYVVGLTQDYQYFDGLIPHEIYESWESY